MHKGGDKGVGYGNSKTHPLSPSLLKRGGIKKPVVKRISFQGGELPEQML